VLGTIGDHFRVARMPKIGVFHSVSVNGLLTSARIRIATKSRILLKATTRHRGLQVIRTIVTIITFLSFAGVLDAECVLMPPLESSSHVRIYVVLAGKPLKGAKVILRPQHDCNCATDMLRVNPMDATLVPSKEMTDENGIANLPELTPGEYDVAVTLNGVASTAFVGLHVSGDPKVTTIPMDLTQQVQRVRRGTYSFSRRGVPRNCKGFFRSHASRSEHRGREKGISSGGCSGNEQSRRKWEFFGSISRGLLHRGLFCPWISPRDRPIRSSKRRRQPAFNQLVPRWLSLDI
jgi:hypothetical protein